VARCQARHKAGHRSFQGLIADEYQNMGMARIIGAVAIVRALSVMGLSAYLLLGAPESELYRFYA